MSRPVHYDVDKAVGDISAMFEKLAVEARHAAGADEDARRDIDVQVLFNEMRVAAAKGQMRGVNDGFSPVEISWALGTAIGCLFLDVGKSGGAHCVEAMKRGIAAGMTPVGSLSSHVMSVDPTTGGNA